MSREKITRGALGCEVSCDLALARLFAAKFVDARFAGTDFAEMAEAVNPGGVTVGKFNLNGIIPHRCRGARSDLRLK